MFAHRVALNTLSAILVVAILYLLACLVDMHVTPFTETVKSLDIINSKGVIVSSHHDKQINLEVRRGETISFNVRYYTMHNAQLQVKRYLVGPNNVQRELSEYTEYFSVAGDIRDSVVMYPIPHSAPLGCGYTLYSHVDVTYPFNILMRIAPIDKNIARGSSFCITE